MSSTRRTTALAALLAPLALGFVTAASAQKQAPGLWEITMQTKSASGQMESAHAQMQEQLAKMPAEQRKMVQEMMAKQGVGTAPGGGQSIRVCITPEMAARGDVPQDPKGNCKHVIGERSASKMSFKFTCTDPASSGSGEITFSGDKQYAMKMSSETTVAGKPERIEMQHQARWVAADCGNLKPPAAAKR